MASVIEKLRIELEADPGTYFQNNGARRFGNTLDTLLDHAPPPARLLDIGGDRSDFLKRKPGGRMPYSFGHYFRAAGYTYTSCNESDLDARADPLPYPDESFEVVTAWEIIEHLWQQGGGGLAHWGGILNFWQEAHRVLEPGGLFFCATRNRWCPLAWHLMREGKSGGCYYAESEGDELKPGHVREFTAEELVAISRATDTYPVQSTLSRSCLSASMESRVAGFVGILENFIGRTFRPEEMHDSVYFLGRKAQNV